MEEFTIEEQNVLEKVKEEMQKAKDYDAISKIYRQARNWSRYHCYFAIACTPTKCRELNRRFSSFRNAAVRNLTRRGV